MEELVCQGYGLSAQAIQHRQAARPVSSNGSSHFLMLEDYHETEALKAGRQRKNLIFRWEDSILNLVHRDHTLILRICFL